MLIKAFTTISTFPIPSLENMLAEFTSSKFGGANNKIDQQIIFAIKHGLSQAHDKNVKCRHLHFELPLSVG